MIRKKVSQTQIGQEKDFRSILIVLIGGDKSAAFAGWVYGLPGPVMTFYGIMSSKRVQKLKTGQVT